MTTNAEYDLKGLSQLISKLDGALFSQGGDGDIHRVLKTEAGQLAWDISMALGPRSKSAGDKKVERDVKQFLTPKPIYSNLDQEQQYSSYGDFTWLAAGPSFLTGINDEDNQLGASTDDALLYFRAGQYSGSRGPTYVTLGQRGKKKIQRLNRVRVSQSTMRSVVNVVKGSFGLLRASFAFTAVELIPGKRVPDWVSRHFSTKARGRAIFSNAGLNHPTEPYIEFGSSAKGVESNPRIAQIVSGQIERRKRLMAEKIRKVVAGYAYDWNTGRVFKRREAKVEEED